jgi:AraC-like DNA-binding protein
MFLIQLDDYGDNCRQFPDFNSYPCKANIAQNVQAYLEHRNIEGVVSRLVGHDAVAAYVYMEGKTIMDVEARARVGTLAQDVIGYVGDKTGESISIGISDFCSSHAHFQQAYAECKAAILQSFYSGKRTVSFFDKQKAFSGVAQIPAMRTAFINVVSALDCGDSGRCSEIFAGLCGSLKDMEMHPTTARLHMIGMISRVADYYIDAGLDAEEIEPAAISSMAGVLGCGFIGGIQGIVEAFCASVRRLHKSAYQSVEARFRQYVDDCIEKYSADCSFSLTFAAALSNYSPSYFSRLFAKVYGVPFSRYLADYRIDKAIRLLAQEALSLQDIAMKTGFRSTSYFCSVFKSRMAASPRQYQNRRLKEAGAEPAGMDLAGGADPAGGAVELGGGAEPAGSGADPAGGGSP